MKTYFIRYWADFANTFDLAWADNDADREWLEARKFERCSRKHAEHKARNERDTAKYDPAFSGYGSDAILPTKYYKLTENEQDAQTWLYRNCELRGVIYE